MNQILLIAIGGALGAVLRYSMVIGMDSFLTIKFPYGTLLVNILGSFIIGSIYAAFAQNTALETWVKPLLIIGILGGFTTFSSYSFELFTLIKENEIIKAISYMVLSNVMAVGATFMGYKVFAS
jgi:CrcB protein